MTAKAVARRNERKPKMDKEDEVQRLRQEGMSFEEIQRWYNAYDDDSGLLALAETLVEPISPAEEYLAQRESRRGRVSHWGKPHFATNND